jgi:hypothetical protein
MPASPLLLVILLTGFASGASHQVACGSARRNFRWSVSGGCQTLHRGPSCGLFESPKGRGHRFVGGSAHSWEVRHRSTHQSRPTSCCSPATPSRCGPAKRSNPKRRRPPISCGWPTPSGTTLVCPLPRFLSPLPRSDRLLWLLFVQATLRSWSLLRARWSVVWR